MFTENIKHGHTKHEIRRRLTSAQSHGFLRDCVFGGIDGTITTFAIVSGVTGAGLSHGVILVLGIANLTADGFSMAAGNYTATKSDSEKIDHLIEIEQDHLQRFPEGEEEELRQILEGYGYQKQKLRDAIDTIKLSPRLWIELMLRGEYGVTSVRQKPLFSAIATFVSFVVCGSVPLMPFLLKLEHAGIVAGVATCSVFFLVGAVKTIWTKTNWWLSGIETLLIGTLAAGIAFISGSLLSHIVS